MWNLIRITKKARETKQSRDFFQKCDRERAEAEAKKTPAQRLQEKKKKEAEEERTKKYLKMLSERKDGEEIFLNSYCSHCRYNKTGEIGFVFHGKEYCVDCYPRIVNAYLATKRLKESEGRPK